MNVLFQFLRRLGLLQDETLYYIGGSDILPPPLKGQQELDALEALEQGSGTACLLVPACDPKALRAAAEQLAKERTAVFALVIPGESPAVMLLRSKGDGPDLGAALRTLLQQFPGKGGGSPVLAQATFAPETDPGALLEALKTLL